MSVSRFFDRDDFLASTQQTAFTCRTHNETHNDLSQAILPTFLRYKDRALQYYESRLMNTLFRWFLPCNMLQNSVAGAPIPLTIEEGIHTHDRMTLQKGGGGHRRRRCMGVKDRECGYGDDKPRALHRHLVLLRHNFGRNIPRQN